MLLTIYKNGDVSRKISLHSSFFHLEKKNGKLVNSPSQKAHDLMHDYFGNGFILTRQETILQKWGRYEKT
jgi:hypothetical protein